MEKLSGNNVKKPFDTLAFIQYLYGMTTTQKGQEQGAGLAYPLFALQGCMKVAEAVRDLGGTNADVSRAMLAHRLGASEKAATFTQRVGSAKYFGLIEGRATYRLSPAANSYFYPTSDTDKSRAMLNFLGHPAIFAGLIQRFDGTRLPEQAVLGNFLHREHGVPESWKDRVAGFFLRSAEYVGVVDSQGMLRFKAAQGAGWTLPPVSEPEIPGPTVHVTAPQPPPIARGGNVWRFSHQGKTVQVETPQELDEVLWDKLNRYVELLKPVGEQS